MKEYRELRSYYRILADVTRLRILHALGQTADVTVSHLCTLLDVTQPLMSWHLRMLRRAGLVRTRRRGRQVYCSLDAATVAIYEARLQRLISGAVVPDTGVDRKETAGQHPVAVAASQGVVHSS